MKSLRTLIAFALLLSCAATAAAAPPAYIYIRQPRYAPRQPHQQPPSSYRYYGVAAPPYAYGHFGVQDRRHWSRHFGYYRNYTQWSAR